MVVVQNPEEYKLIGFEISPQKYKKYNAILRHNTTGRLKYVPFGDTRYQHFRDSTGLNVYSNLDHGDRKRQINYLKRHANTKDNLYSSSYFSSNYLW
jgi:hypothetical protein